MIEFKVCFSGNDLSICHAAEHKNALFGRTDAQEQRRDYSSLLLSLGASAVDGTSSQRVDQVNRSGLCDFCPSRGSSAILTNQLTFPLFRTIDLTVVRRGDCLG